MVHSVHYGPVELGDGSLWGSDANPLNAERMLMATNAKDVSVDNVHRCHEWGSASQIQSLLAPLAQSISLFDAFCKPLAFPFGEETRLEIQKVSFTHRKWRGQCQWHMARNLARSWGEMKNSEFGLCVCVGGGTYMLFLMSH